MLDRSDLDEEQKQSILVAMNCPCCGGSGLSFTMKLKREEVSRYRARPTAITRLP